MSSILAVIALADAGDAGAGGVFLGLSAVMIIFLLVALAATAFWIWMLVDCVTSSMPDTEKIIWVLVIFFLHLVGALLYFVLKRNSASIALR